MRADHPTPTGSRVPGSLFLFGRPVSAPLAKALFALSLPLLVVLIHKTGVGCVWRHFLHIPCPGCGMTRAAVALLHGDLAKMLRGHFMLPFLPLVALLILFDGRLFRDKRANTALLLLLAAGFLARWLCALTGVLPV